MAVSTKPSPRWEQSRVFAVRIFQGQMVTDIDRRVLDRFLLILFRNFFILIYLRYFFVVV
jgi:hypothetical protein